MAVVRSRSDGVPVNGARAAGLGIVVAAVVAAGVFAASAFATTRSETSLQSLNHQVLAAVNRFRRAHGRAPLSAASGLDRSAHQHSFEMGEDGYFAHPSADGTSFWRRIQHYYTQGHHAYWSVGENLLWASPTVSVGRAMRMWIASPEHLQNLLSRSWRQIGVSAVRVPHAPGVFHGLPVTIITADFGVRR